MNYFADFVLDGGLVFDLILSDVAQRWRSGKLTPRELADLCWNLAEEADMLPFLDLDEFRAPYFCWEYANQNLTTWERFRANMEIFFTTGHCPFPTI